MTTSIEPHSELAAGAWLHNPATGELARVNTGPSDTDGRWIETDLWLRPGAAVARAHVHDALTERFEVLAGEVEFVLAGKRTIAEAGSGPVVVPSGVAHDWWNTGDSPAHVRVTVEATEGSPARPAARFVAAIEALWSLAALGKTDAKGVPDLLWLAAIARQYDDVIHFVRPPAVVQAAVFGPLAALARRTGRDPLADELHGRSAACVISRDEGERLSAQHITQEAH